jgi:glycosyltransferase involved in cell wall biosynthesis
MRASQGCVGARRLLEASSLLDVAWYRGVAALPAGADPAEHYVTAGWKEGLEPGPAFDGAFLDPYYRSIGLVGPPAVVYLVLREAGWPVFATRAEAEAAAAAIRSSDLFNAESYAAGVKNIATLDPALHYVIVGERSAFAPSKNFDPAYYGERYPEIGEDAVNRLGHYLTSGRAEGRRALPAATTLEFDRSRLDPKRKTILLVSHQATRSGAPILAYNLAVRLRRKYNVVVALLAGGDLFDDFSQACNAVVGPLAPADRNPIEIKYVVKHALEAYELSYAIVNSLDAGMFVPSLARAFLPVVLLVHEFASYARPKSAVRDALNWANEIVFPADLVARSAQREYPGVRHRPAHLLPQGRTEVPPGRESIAASNVARDLARAFRPAGSEKALVVFGCGSVYLRKGVDLFVSCAAAVAAMRPRRPVRFVWVGSGYDPDHDTSYSSYLADQIARSELDGTVAMVDEIPSVDPAYDLADVFFLSSRLDPLPNAAIDAMLHSLPVVCFQDASGIADLLATDPSARGGVVPYLDVQAAARVIVQLAEDETKRHEIGQAVRRIGSAAFDMDRYVGRLDALGLAAAATMRQRGSDFATLRDDATFDPDVYLPLDAPRTTRTEAIVDFLARWAAVGMASGSKDLQFRRPCAGFHPQAYAHAHTQFLHANAINPLAHFIRAGKPDGPWRHDVIEPSSDNGHPQDRAAPSTALHAHFHYPELAEDFLGKIGASRSRCDLLLSTDESGKARILRHVTSPYRRGEVHIRVLPNLGRDIGAFLTGFGADLLARYQIIGHVHGKRSPSAGGQSDPALGERWREFLWQNLLGGSHPMMDVVIGRLAADEKLGFVFAEDPHLCGWDANRGIAEALAARMGMTEALPPFFDFPVGTMFWARTAALRPLFDLRLAWEDYPPEPAPYDGTILHAIERLLPLVAHHAGYRYATTHVPGVTW